MILSLWIKIIQIHLIRQQQLNILLAKAGHVKVIIYNILGQKVITLVDQTVQPGNYKATWNGINQYNQPVGSGTYFYMIRTGDFKEVKRMVLIR